jgi:hypothetical protein
MMLMQPAQLINPPIISMNLSLISPQFSFLFATDVGGCSSNQDTLQSHSPMEHRGFGSQGTGRDRPLSALNGSCDGNRLRPVLRLPKQLSNQRIMCSDSQGAKNKLMMP